MPGTNKQTNKQERKNIKPTQNCLLAITHTVYPSISVPLRAAWTPALQRPPAPACSVFLRTAGGAVVCRSALGRVL